MRALSKRKHEQRGQRLWHETCLSLRLNRLTRSNESRRDSESDLRRESLYARAPLQGSSVTLGVTMLLGKDTSAITHYNVNMQ